MTDDAEERKRPHHGARGPAGAWTLWIAIPLDAAGLYLVLACLDLLPVAWPTPHAHGWVLIAAAVALFAAARAIALVALRGLLKWRIASDSWSRLVRRSHTH